MDFDDPIHGRCTIAEPVILALLDSRVVQRLHGVLQHGITAILGHTRPITRYEHSCGAMLLVRRLGGSVREQVAALLHDVSHTAFSHVIDHVFDAHGPHSYHEQKKAEWLARSDVPGILQAHGLNWTDFLQDEPFPLLEQPSPRLCADRLDYFLRDASALDLLSASDIRQALQHLVVRQGRLAVDDLATAQLLGYRYLATDEAFWSNPQELLLYELTAQAIKTALARDIIREADLWTVDQQLWEKLRTARDAQVQQQVAQLSSRPRFVVDEANPTIRIPPKVRTIDPDIAVGDGLRRLSELDPDFRRSRDDYIQRKARGLALRLLT
jgi:HD superfamily phosphohydrolase